MSISQVPDSQKVDYLWKKIGFGAAKTDISGNVDATQEPFPSPLQIRADKIMQQSGQIPSIIPSSNTSVVTVFTSSFPIQCTNDSGITTPTLTWETGQTFWIPPEFGPTYQIKAWIAPSGNAANVASKGTQIFATGSGNNDEWFFDYQSGILQFNGNNTPYSGGSPISFTGNSVYISGAVYSGTFGLPAAVSIGNITFSNTTISTSFANGNVYLSPTGTGTVQITGNLALGIPSGNISTRPSNALIGFTRFNTDNSQLETWNGNTWITPGQATISSDIINPDGTSNVYTLSSNSTTTGVMVSINGTLQQPFTAYNIVSNNEIQFSEIPLTTDVIEVRHLNFNGATVSSYELINGTTEVLLDTANVNITGNVLPTSNVAYDLGSPTLRWRTGYFSASTIDLGGSTIGVTNNAFVFTSNGVTQTLSANGVSTANTLVGPTTTVQGNLAVGGNIVVTGNLTVLGTTTSVNTEIINQSEIVTGNISAGNITVNSIITTSTILAGTVNATTIGNSGALLTGTLQTASQPNITTLAGLTSFGNGGNTSVNGNLNVSGSINFIGNINQINITGNSGQFFGNVNGFGALYAGIGTGYVFEPQTILQLSANYNGYSQLNIQNINSGNIASTDIVATADNGNALVGFIDMGINSSTYNQAGYGLTGFNDGYLYVLGNAGVSSGNLVLSTYNSNADIIFSVGGGDTGNEIGRFNNATKTFKVTGNLASTGYASLGAVYSPTIGNTGATLTGTIQTANQPNITTIGTLGNLNVTGNITAGNINAGGVRQTTSSTAPTNPTVGDQWYDTSTDILFQFEYDGTNHVWVDITSAPLNTNVAIITGVSISVSSNASVGTSLAVGQALTVNQSNVATAIVNGAGGGWGNIGTASVPFQTVFSVASTAVYADLAELYVADNSYIPGTVVVFGGNQEITISTTDHDSAVAGVISVNPAYTMNTGIDGLPVALQGRVPCQVQGPINKGELVVTSNTPGIAQRLDQTKWRPGCVIGKSLETINDDTIATIEVVVGRN